MEIEKRGILTANHPLKLKTLLMLSHQQLSRIIIIGFMVLVGYALAKAFYHNSVLGIILGLTSLGAGIYFLHLLVKAREEMEAEERA